MKQTYNIHNEQGAYLMQVDAKDEKNAIRQARKVWSGKIKASEYGN